jgi:hypothetical protein
MIMFSYLQLSSAGEFWELLFHRERMFYVTIRTFFSLVKHHQNILSIAPQYLPMTMRGARYRLFVISDPDLTINSLGVG